MDREGLLRLQTMVPQRIRDDTATNPPPSILSLRFIRVIKYGMISFLFQGWIKVPCIFSLSIYPSTNIQVVFIIWAILNYTAVNLGVQMPLQDADFISFVCVPRSEISGSCDSSSSNFLRNLLTVFVVPIHHFTLQQFTRVPVSPHPCWLSFSFVLLVINIQTGVRWYLIMVWFAFPNDFWYWASFKHSYYLFVCLLCRSVCSNKP